MSLVLALAVMLTGRDIRLGDLIPAERLRRAAVPHLARRVVARIPPWRSDVTLTHETASLLIRRQIPEAPSALFAFIVPQRFRVGDASRSKVGDKPNLPMPDVAAGATLQLRSTAGAVSVARQVTALQAGKVGRRMFVRDADGHVLSVQLTTSERR